jgi:hypothetical protein
VNVGEAVRRTNEIPLLCLGGGEGGRGLLKQ